MWARSTSRHATTGNSRRASRCGPPRSPGLPVVLAFIIVAWMADLFAGSVYKYETYGQGYDQVDFRAGHLEHNPGPSHGRLALQLHRLRFSAWTGCLCSSSSSLFYAIVPSAAHALLPANRGAALGPSRSTGWPATDWPANGGGASVWPTCSIPLFALRRAQPLPGASLLGNIALLLRSTGLKKANGSCSGSALCWRCCAHRRCPCYRHVRHLCALTRVWAPGGRLPLGGGLSTLRYQPSCLSLVPYPDAFRGSERPIPDPYAVLALRHNPVLAYYGHLGKTGPEIMWYMVTHPVDVAQIDVQPPERSAYMLSMLLAPLLFLPLFRCAPSGTLPAHTCPQSTVQPPCPVRVTSITTSLLLVPGLFAAAIYGADNLSGFVGGD